MNAGSPAHHHRRCDADRMKRSKASPFTRSRPPFGPVRVANSRPERAHLQTVVRCAPTTLAMVGVE